MKKQSKKWSQKARCATRHLLNGFICGVLFFCAIAGSVRNSWAAKWQATTVDFRYSPPQWQTLICLPDDSCKTLVDKSGSLLYDYGQGGREFGTTVSVEVATNAIWQKQELLSPRIPIVRTYFSADGVKILEEAFAVTESPRLVNHEPALARTDGWQTILNWAHPAGNVDPSLDDIAVHYDGSLGFEACGKHRLIALALCEGWWDQPGKRIEVLRVEGAAPRTVDTVADIGRNKAAVFWFDGKDTNGDGKIDISVDAADKAADKNTILNGLWVFPTHTPEDGQALLAGKLNDLAIARMDRALMSGQSHSDLVLVHVTNTSRKARTLDPKVIVNTALGCRLEGQHIVINDNETVTCFPGIKQLVNGKTVRLESITVPPNQTTTCFALYSYDGKIDLKPFTVKGAVAARDRAIRYWEKAPLPYGRVKVPDAGIQALIDSSIRNMWQARDIKDGVSVFQTGPTCYRGVWVVDSAFITETAAMLGAANQASNCIMCILRKQTSSGAFEVLSPRFYKENGIVLWTCLRYAMLTQDKAWLESVWPRLLKTANYIKELRRLSYEDGNPLDDGLSPPGEIDGGLSGAKTGFKHPEYSNVYWNLAGVRAFVQAALWLGKTNAAASWQREYDNFYATFRKAAARDMCKDSKGDSYLPIFMGNWGDELPQRAQWSFLQAVYPGEIFPKDDPLVVGTLHMLEATEREGMVYGTGWDATGIWTYFASFYAHAWLWKGNGRKAYHLLYAFANHAAPVLDWREEQSLKGAPYQKIGDMPHNWASAEFIRLTIHLLEIDRGDELHLFEGLPREWAKPGMITSLDGIATPFGKLFMRLKIAADGKTANLHVEPLSGGECKKIVVHLGGWATSKASAVIELNPRVENDRTIVLGTN